MRKMQKIKKKFHEPKTEEPKQKTIKVRAVLRVENNSSFVRGKKKSQEDIEFFVLQQYNMEKVYPDGGEYILTIPYTTEKDLEETIDEIYSESERIADSRNGFLQDCDIYADDGSGKGW